MTRIQPKPVQTPTTMPVGRYRAFEPVVVPDRTWPAKRITKAPRWLSTDLRDGNQALIDPMTPNRKMRMFELLVALGWRPRPGLCTDNGAMIAAVGLTAVRAGLPPSSLDFSALTGLPVNRIVV